MLLYGSLQLTAEIWLTGWIADKYEEEKRMGVAALIVKTKSPPKDADAAVAVDPVSDNGDAGMVYVFLLRNSMKGKKWTVALYMVLWYLFYLFATLASLSGYDHWSDVSSSPWHQDLTPEWFQFLCFDITHIGIYVF